MENESIREIRMFLADSKIKDAFEALKIYSKLNKNYDLLETVNEMERTFNASSNPSVAIEIVKNKLNELLSTISNSSDKTNVVQARSADDIRVDITHKGLSVKGSGKLAVLGAVAIALIFIIVK